MKKLFNEEQEKFIKEHYLTMTDTDIAKALGNYTQQQVTGWRLNNGIKHKRRMSNLFTEDDISFMKENYNKMSYKEIGEYLGYTERQIRGKINNMDLTKNRKINDHYFDDIDTSLKAYFLGFIFADGWITYKKENRSYEFGMQLQSGDKYILDKLNDELGGNLLMTHTEPGKMIILGKEVNRGHLDKIRVFSKNLVLALEKNGIAKNKTLKDICPHVSDELFFDFMRGYIDGDGCFWKYKNHYYMHITCASEKVLLYLQERLKTFDIETKLYKEADKKYRLMCINIKEMQKLVNKLYPSKDVFCLKRKIEKVEEYLIGSAA